MEVVVYLTNKYKDDAYMSKKLEHYLENLPQVMQGIEEDHLTRLRLKRDFIERRDNYIEWFITHYAFFYHSPTEQYLKYTRNQFSVISEDELMQFIMRSLHIDFNLHRGKQQMKRRVMRRIKSTQLFLAQPTTVTLDNVLRYFHNQFANDVQTTYFLTCIGDILLGKRNLYYFMDAAFKPLVHGVAQGLYTTVNKHISDDFKFKFYDHDYNKCRIVPGLCTGALVVSIRFLDVAVISTFLSHRYGSSDAYLNQPGNEALEQIAMVLHANCSASGLVDKFLAEYTAPPTAPTLSLTYKNMYFLWKFFLFKHTLPFVLSQQNFKQMLAAKGVYDVSTDTCSVQSKCSLAFLNFELFWGLTMIEDPTSSYTFDELRSLYQDWCSTKPLLITDEECKEWVENFHPENVNGNNVLFGFKCKLWDKTIDIENALETFPGNDTADWYDYYRECTLTHSKRVATKEYVTHYIESR
jgi:hypothetical protein